MQSTKLLSADRIGGLIWVAFGIAVVYGAWAMDRLQSLGIPPAIIFGSILLVRHESGAGDAPEPATAASTEATASADAMVPAAHAEEFDWKRVALSWLLCVTYGGVLLGSGLHYWALTASFLFLHILLLDETDRVPASPTVRRLVIAAVVAPAVATVVMLTFERIFLVRLP